MTEQELTEQVKAELTVHGIMSAVSDLLVLRSTSWGREILSSNEEDLKLTYSVLGNLIEGIQSKEAA